ncbi:hypothetical protein PybrP1_003277 [[Pythium] brassicae (nom. inval.)]|nr:hypothetical protein PybrP1_003277 [[Pythium] brassicae (nom. inval.)]
MVELESVVLLLVVAAAGAAYVLLVDLPRRRELENAQRLKQKVAEQHAAAAKKSQAKPKPKRVDVTAEKKRKQQPETEGSAPEHAANLHVLAGHKYALTCAAYSPNGRFVATASTDRTVRVFARDALHDKNVKPHVISIEYDHVTAMTFSCDGKTLVVVTEGGLLKMYQKLRVKPELVAEFPVAHKTDVHSVIMNDIGNWATLVTCAGGADTDVKFWSLSGQLLQVVNTNQVANYHCVGSKDNRYIAVAAYTPEVKILEITREKNGLFKKVNKIMTLQGHRTGVLDLAFNGSDTAPVTRMLTVCKDASVRLWDINVRYVVSEDPKMLTTFNASELKPYQSVDLSPNAKLLVAARDRDVLFISTSDGRELETIPHALDGDIARVVFAPSGDEVLVVGKKSKAAKLFRAPKL